MTKKRTTASGCPLLPIESSLVVPVGEVGKKGSLWSVQDVYGADVNKHLARERCHFGFLLVESRESIYALHVFRLPPNNREINPI